MHDTTSKKMLASKRELLEAEFNKNMNWSREKIVQLARRLDFSYVKVYKWHYDRKQRVRAEMEAQAKLRDDHN